MKKCAVHRRYMALRRFLKLTVHSLLSQINAITRNVCKEPTFDFSTAIYQKLRSVLCVARREEKVNKKSCAEPKNAR